MKSNETCDARPQSGGESDLGDVGDSLQQLKKIDSNATRRTKVAAVRSTKEKLHRHKTISWKGRDCHQEPWKRSFVLFTFQASFTAILVTRFTFSLLSPRVVATTPLKRVPFSSWFRAARSYSSTKPQTMAPLV